MELAESASARWAQAAVLSDFLTPSVLADSLSALSQVSDLVAVPWGGYPQAERCRIALGREDVMHDVAADPMLAGGVSALQLQGNFLFDAATHADFLGATIGTGVVRDKVGDILVQGETGAQILVDSSLVDHFEATLTQVRSVSVQTRPIELSALKVRPPKVEEISSVEASMRLDAIASAGFRMSRGKMTDLVKGGDVRVNWREARKASVEVKAGDVISCRGKGRLEVREVGTTKKGKFSVQMVRFV